MIKWLSTITAAVLLSLSTAHGFAAEEGAISIPIKEYERLKEYEEGDQKKQYWKMTFEQILSKENNNYTKAYELYDFWVLRNVYLDSGVDRSSVARLTAQIHTLNKIGTTPITMYISSPGGGVLEGLSLINVMNHSIAPINTVCDSYAFSMGAVLFAVGKHRVSTEGCAFMIHDVGVGAAGGQTMEHVKWTETIINIETQLVDILSKATGYDHKEVRSLMEYETFWNGEETFRLGFADEYYPMIRKRMERDIPEDLIPLNRMKKNFNEKLTK